jgi:uncharacterized circularly permuted ATP-grasp superfamily protein
VLTPGIFNSAYFEHSFLAQRMGAELVEGQDLVVGDDECVYMKTIQGLERVDVIYRRIDDLFIDPEAFLPDSMLGVAGLMRAWKAGNVGIANAPGAGVADDKVVYAWVPDMIRYYLGEDPLIPNVPTYRCMYDTSVSTCSPTSATWSSSRPTRAAGTASSSATGRAPTNSTPPPSRSVPTRATGWRSRSSTCRRAHARRRRHRAEALDLRPFILTGESSYVTAGGLTRVALTKGSLVVNSSQGGGSKDTWIVDTNHPSPPTSRSSSVAVPIAVGAAG